MNYKFCPKCAGVLESRKLDHTSHPVCKACGFVFYQNSKPTASTVIINDKDEVLLIKRAINPHFGKWDIPGGFLENGEDPIEGLKREAKEELSIEIEPLEILTIVVDEYGYVKGDFFTLNLFYKCKISSGEIKLDSENSDYHWFSKERIPWDELAFKNTEVALKKLYNLA
jgi:mutator protein MutT